MPAEQQEPIEGLDACRVKFVDMTMDKLDEPPDIDDHMEFTVAAVCVGRTRERMKDGELRHTAKMRVVSLEPNGGPRPPNAGPNLFALGDDDE